VSHRVLRIEQLSDLLPFKNVDMEAKVTATATIPPEHTAPVEDWDGMFDALQTCSHTEPQELPARIDRDHRAVLTSWADGEGLD
jgi:hypothetical protein